MQLRVEQIRQAAVKLPRAADDSCCSNQHTLKPVGNKPRRPSQHGVTIVNTRCNESMNKCDYDNNKDSIYKYIQGAAK